MAISATGSAAPAASTTPSNGAGTTSAAEQQDRFMKLLVAQMRNQDPLNPMDNAQMTSQIAQINTVAGIEKLNATVQGLAGAMVAMQAQTASQLPGRAVLVEGRALRLADGPAQGGVSLAARADRVSVEIVAADGQVVQTLELGALPAGVRSFTWDGRTAEGGTAPAGEYRLRVNARAAGEPVQATTLAAASVRSVVPTPQGIELDLGASGRAGWGDVYAFL
ncbi:flagellar hook assembly protein FlgD [Ramlibacter sp. AW1]|uniref:Basal-body rod modification protein FlgD n=1 Tax=Ramlibacter aurantiacus TaxID=2801330 RepID=A0A936ZVF4_9BURK|nr:flagellar hook assembly protein FlgD [Ramlibacter aurantiacus]MBL0423326.1 flagellar hook assembly protein FlgD [Ramlibacter aurantiacus]